MKHIKTFENYDISNLQNIIPEKLLNNKKELLQKLENYMYYKWNITSIYGIYVIDYSFDGENFIITYDDEDESERLKYKVEDTNELYNFLDNPNMFRKIKQYNV